MGARWMSPDLLLYSSSRNTGITRKEKFINGDWLEDQIRSFFNQAKENDLSFLSKYSG
jgi:hypothetical protein